MDIKWVLQGMKIKRTVYINKKKERRQLLLLAVSSVYVTAVELFTLGEYTSKLRSRLICSLD